MASMSSQIRWTTEDMTSPRTIVQALPGGESMEMVWIAPGTFMMGSSKAESGRNKDETCLHQVALTKGFYLGKFPITQAQWSAVMGTQPWQGRTYVQPHPNHPAVYISWNDVQMFISKLNVHAKEALFRLPTEAEWEYACRVGTSTRWSFGDDEGKLPEYAWYGANPWNAGMQYAQPVGTKRPNPWGLYDMHGNVYEWTQDWYASYYPEAPCHDPNGPERGAYRVLRGGHFYYNAQSTRSAHRYAGSPDGRGAHFGARLARIE